MQLYLSEWLYKGPDKVNWSKTKLKAKLKVYVEIVYILKIFRVVGISEAVYTSESVMFAH